MTPRTPCRGRRTPRRGRPNRIDNSARAALAAEPLEDRSQASTTTTALLQAPDLAAAIVAADVVDPPPVAPVVSHTTTDGPDLVHRLTSLDRDPADIDQLAGATAPQVSPVFASTPQPLIRIDFDLPDRGALARDLLAAPGGSVEVVELTTPRSGSDVTVVFTLGESDTPLRPLTVTARSDNPALVADANIRVMGSPTKRVLHLTPTVGVTGRATITVSLGDGTATTTMRFVLTVTPAQVNQLPATDDRTVAPPDAPVDRADVTVRVTPSSGPTAPTAPPVLVTDAGRMYGGADDPGVLPAVVSVVPPPDVNTTPVESRAGSPETPRVPVAVVPLLETPAAPAAVVQPPVPVGPVTDVDLAVAVRVVEEVRRETRVIAVTEAAVVTGVSLVAGYVLLNTRAVNWFLIALLVRPAVWRPFDPLDVIRAWEQDDARTGDQSLASATPSLRRSAS